jgi:hypothetical protein
MPPPTPIDRFLAVNLSPDRMSAVLVLASRPGKPPAQGRDPTVPDASALAARIVELAEARGVTAPIDHSVMSSAIASWSRRGSRLEVTLARGRAPVPGTDAHVTLRRPRAAEPKPGGGPDRVDKRNQGRVANVEAGVVLAVTTSPTAGVAGHAVTGEVVPAPPGRAAAITAGPLVIVEESAGVTTYRARETGILVELSEHRIEVAHNIDIPGSVDHETGNLDVWGSVTIRGSVVDGFAVRARGDVTVGGGCESAYVESGGDVTVAGGILGKNGITMVKCKGNCTARFVENATVESGGTVTVADFVLQSRISAVGGVEVTGRGTVLSTTIMAGRSVAALSLGSDARLPVELVVGHHPVEWRLLRRLERELSFARRVSLAGADRGRRHGDPQGRAAADRAASRRRAAAVLETSLLRRRRTMVDALMDSGGPTVRVHREVFPKVRVRLGPYVLDVDMPLRAGVFRIDAGKRCIVWEPET